MSFEIARTLIAAKLATMPTPGFPVVWEGGKEAPRGAAWGRWSIQQGSTIPATLGGSLTRGTGMVTLQVFMPEESGTKAATAAADIMAAHLNRVQLVQGTTVVTFETVGMVDAGSRAGYLQKNLACIFTRDTYSP